MVYANTCCGWGSNFTHRVNIGHHVYSDARGQRRLTYDRYYDSLLNFKPKQQCLKFPYKVYTMSHKTIIHKIMVLIIIFGASII